MTAGAILLLSALVFFCDSATLLALALATAAHELGHWAVLCALGARVSRICADAGGLCMEHSGALSRGAEIAAALAGPLAGALLCVLCALAGERTGSTFLYEVAGVSAALTVFNLLPALPLDGGRVLETLCGTRAVAVSGLITALLLLSAGLAMVLLGMGAWCLAAAAVLTLYQAHL